MIELVRDLHKVTPWIYWVDLLASAAIGWAALAGAVSASGWALPLLTAIAVLALYRALCFMHEISHQSDRSLPGFEIVWNLIAGFPMLLPSVAYAGVHSSHHRLSTYGTVNDPEYLPFAQSAGMTAVFAVQSVLLPAAFAVRFLVLAPLGFLVPRFERWLIVHFSSLSMNVHFRREVTPDVVWTVRWQSVGILVLWAVLIAWLPVRFFAFWYVVSATISLINALRTLGAHAYKSDGNPRDREAQLLDSIDTPALRWGVLWAPVGLRFHGLHHYLPGIPYHNLGQGLSPIEHRAAGRRPVSRRSKQKPLAVAEHSFSRRIALMHYGIVTPPVPGHIHPFGALGRELISRGHRVTVLQMEDIRWRAMAEELEFAALGESDHPAGSLDRSLAQLGGLKGLAALRFTIAAVGRTTEMICRDAPQAVKARGIDRLLVDQMEPAGGAVADHLGIPFFTVCNALALNREANVPPPFTGWKYSGSAWSRAKNSVGYAIHDRLMAPIMQTVGAWRERWGLAPLRCADDSFSRLAQISQMTRGFDFPREHLPHNFVYVGPLRREMPASPIPFPWERLDGRPLIYASLGTLQHAKRELFATWAEACAPLPVQLVIAHNGGLDEAACAQLAGDPLTVHFAPQREVLKRAALALTHAGLNTVLDSLAAGTPLVAMPITYEQPAIAARVAACGAGMSISMGKLTAANLREAVCSTLRDRCRRDRAEWVAAEIRNAGGVKKAADIIEAAG